MKVNRTEQIYIKENKTVSMLCHLSKNLYNQTNYILRNQFIKHETLDGYSKIKNVMHGISKAIVAYARAMNIDTIVIGHNRGWKQLVNISRKNNQNFVQLPFSTLIQQIKYKAEENGINVNTHL